MQIGLPKSGPAPAKARAAAERTGNLRGGTPAARASPIAGPFETNRNAKRWEVLSPAGDLYVCRNLRLWCEQNTALFPDGDWRRAATGLKTLHASNRGKTKRPVAAWKGWTLREIKP